MLRIERQRRYEPLDLGQDPPLTFDIFGKKKLLAWIFNLGPFPVGGSHLTVNMRHYAYGKPYQADHGVSERMIVDLSNLGRSLHVLPTGESGHLGSPHHRTRSTSISAEDTIPDGRYVVKLKETVRPP
jgi:hypothetical protein